MKKIRSFRKKVRYLSIVNKFILTEVNSFDYCFNKNSDIKYFLFVNFLNYTSFHIDFIFTNLIFQSQLLANQGLKSISIDTLPGSYNYPVILRFAELSSHFPVNWGVFAVYNL